MAKISFAIIQRADGLWNFIKLNGRILCKEWFEDAYSFLKVLQKSKEMMVGTSLILMEI